MQNSKLQFKIKNYFFAVSVIFALLLIAVPVFAAEIYFKTDSTTVRPGDPLEVLVSLNTEKEDINAVEGTVLFPDDILKLENINEANSILTFWPEKPRVYDGNKIKFAGITPGGYQEKTGLLFSITFQAKKEGAGIIEIKDSRVLLNDGQGTPTDVKTPNFQFSIFKEAPISKSQILVSKEDKDQPEEFKPEIAQSPEMFEGKYFLVFATQDKGSGIDHYEVCEGSKKKCVIAESPYLLQNQELNQEIFVKAVDKSGNERVVTIPAQKPLPWYKNYFVIAILIIGLIIAGAILRKILWQRFIKSR